jgi:hypothetical protein
MRLTELEPPCPGCGNTPCDCQEQLDAYYLLYPDEDEPCSFCSTPIPGVFPADGMCERCREELSG